MSATHSDPETSTPQEWDGELTHEVIAALAEWMAYHGATGDEVAHAVTKPWHYRAQIHRMRAGLDPEED